MYKFKQSRLFNAMKFRITGVIFPQTITITNLEDPEKGRVTISKRKWLGLTKDEESILISKLASTRGNYKILTASLVMETTGGFKADLKVDNLWKGTAKKVIQLLEK